MKRLYHKKVYWQKDFDILAKELFNTNYCEPLWEQMLFNKGNKDSIEARDLDKIINEMIAKKRNYYLYEVETIGYNQVTKAVVRTSYNEKKDVSIVFAIGERDKKLIVKTAWLNWKDDFHATLDKSKYYNPVDNNKK